MVELGEGPKPELPKPGVLGPGKESVRGEPNSIVLRVLDDAVLPVVPVAPNVPVVPVEGVGPTHTEGHSSRGGRALHIET